MSDLKDLQKRALDIQQKYAELNDAKNQEYWNLRDYTLGFVGDVGQLAKLIMAKENLRELNDVDAKLEHEIADCLWSVLVIAGKLGIDLEKAFENTMQELDQRIAGDMK